MSDGADPFLPDRCRPALSDVPDSGFDDKFMTLDGCPGVYAPVYATLKENEVLCRNPLATRFPKGQSLDHDHRRTDPNPSRDCHNPRTR